MKKQVFYGAAAVVGLSMLVGSARLGETVHAQQSEDYYRPAPPVVYQAAGPSIESIQSMVDAFRAALGATNNGNVPGPLPEGRREINWDGGGSTATAPAPTPFDGFLVTRGGRFTTRGTGFVQAPVDGLATTFNNPTYTTIFQAFSPVRLFSPVESNVTNARFFIPGGGELPALTSGFGVVFSDVDQQGGDDDKHGYDKYGYDKRDKDRDATTTMSFYGVKGNLLYRADVPASKGDASLSFVGVKFHAARVAYVRIKTGNVAPGPYDNSRHDVVMMDDFIYGEPQAIYDPQDIVDAQAIQDTDSLEDK
jgi:hypothetical protein